MDAPLFGLETHSQIFITLDNAWICIGLRWSLWFPSHCLSFSLRQCNNNNAFLDSSYQISLANNKQLLLSKFSHWTFFVFLSYSWVHLYLFLLLSAKVSCSIAKTRQAVVSRSGDRGGGLWFQGTPIPDTLTVWQESPRNAGEVSCPGSWAWEHSILYPTPITRPPRGPKTEGRITFCSYTKNTSN